MGKCFSNFEQEAWVPCFIKRLCDVSERSRAVLLLSFKVPLVTSNLVDLFDGTVLLSKSKLMVREDSVFC
jgi:hypothetical protein